MVKQMVNESKRENWRKFGKNLNEKYRHVSKSFGNKPGGRKNYYRNKYDKKENHQWIETAEKENIGENNNSVNKKRRTRRGIEKNRLEKHAENKKLIHL